MTIPLALTIAAAAVAVVLTAHFVLRRVVPENGLWGKPEPNHSGSAIAVMGGIFAILVAFTMFLAFQNFTAAKRSAEIEGLAIERQFHAALAFHPRLRNEFHGNLVCYARAVTFDEWPALEDGEASEVVDEWGVEHEAAAEGARLDDPAEAEAARVFDAIEGEREEARRDRVQASQRFVPSLLWVALITGGTLLVLYLLSFANPGVRPGLQALQLAVVTTVAALNLCVVAFLDTPFSGAAGSIEPTAMEQTLAELERDLQEESPETPIPCDESGLPRGEMAAAGGGAARSI